MGSFYAMAFFPSFEGMVCIRSLRQCGYKTKEAAIKAIEHRKIDGYVKRLGINKPIWSNVK